MRPIAAELVPAAARAALIVALTLAAAGAAAGGAVAGGAATVGPMYGGPMYGGPVWPGPPGWPVATPFFYPGACPPYGRCFGPPWDDRRQRQRPVAPTPPPAEPDIWGSTGSPWGYVRRLPPPTPESQIQPRYRDASTVRPEYGGP